MKTPEEKKELHRVSTRKWARENREKSNGIKRAWEKRNLEKARELKREWKRKNPDKVRAAHARRLGKHKIYVRGYKANRRKTDFAYKILENLRVRLRRALVGKNKSSTTVKLLGCPVFWLRHHLEDQFRWGMTWLNYGREWHIDHIRPCASFDLADPGQQKQCFHFENLQPLWKLDNIRKGAKYAAS